MDRKKKIVVISNDEKQRNNIVTCIFKEKKDDIYITFEGINNDLKVSIHQSGFINTAFTDEFLKTNGLKREDRFIEKRCLAKIENEDEIVRELCETKYEVAYCIEFLPTETVPLNKDKDLKKEPIIIRHFAKNEKIVLFFLVGTTDDTYTWSIQDLNIIYRTNLPVSKKDFIIAGTRARFRKNDLFEIKELIKAEIAEIDRKELQRWITVNTRLFGELPAITHINVDNYFR